MASPGGKYKATQKLVQIKDSIDKALVYKTYKITQILKIPLKNIWHLRKIRLFGS